ncbi:MAG: UDP-N-acetylmuramate dehydrogenase [Lentimicrobiaceae bacterium]|nr:UDP-N-acetylmuramate dehydrogenase [Lentimicrobiaceae bacterium]MDD4597159.1 UDP-N-acetylmuramate dehydrogenase [Lentimicrobiaceae bacterium]
METAKTLKLQHNILLKPYNTFGMSVISRDFVEITSESELPELLKIINQYPGRVMFLGGGSNVLFTRDFDGLIVKISLYGIKTLHQDDEVIYVRGMAGENWDNFVQYCVTRNYGGLENLSLIPGNVGTSPIQNIGAYGVELKDTFHMLEAVSLRSGEFREFYAEECAFGYRDSVFKNELKDKYLILAVIFKLNKRPVLNTSYGAIAEELQKMKLSPSVKNIATCITNIRRSKLPDPAVLGNAGSFFKNPVIPAEQAQLLKVKYPEMPVYPAEDGVKLAAGWLIEQCGLKGYRSSHAGVHQNQALVLVNYGHATGSEILALAELIMAEVSNRFNINLQPEVNIIS